MRTLAPLAHVLLLSLLLLPTLCVAPEEKGPLLSALAAQLAIIAGHGVVAPLVLRRARAEPRHRLRAFVQLRWALLLGAAPLPLVVLLCWLLAPGLLWRLALSLPPADLVNPGVFSPARPELLSPSLIGTAVGICGGLFLVALPLWRHELQAAAEFE